MSGFTLRLWFSGLCQFVENRAVGDELSQIQLCVLLLDARKAESPHRACVSTPRRAFRPDGSYRMVFDPERDPLHTFKVASRVEFEFTHVDGWPGAEDAVFRGDDSPTIRLEDLIGNYADGGLDVVSPKHTEGVLAQIVLDRGLCKDPQEGAVRGIWYLPNAVTGDGKDSLPVAVAEPKLVEIPQLLKATMVIRNLEDPTADPIRRELDPDGDELLDLLVSNRCEGGRLALQKRFASDGRSFQLVQLDEDFVEHYKALHPVSLESLSLHRGVLEGRWPNGLPYLVPERVILEVFVSDELFSDTRKQLDLIQLWVELGPDGEPMIVLQENGGRGPSRPLRGFVGDVPGGESLAWVKDVRDFLIKAVSSGSGCDCLPCQGRSRYLDTASRGGGDQSSRMQPSTRRLPRPAAKEPETGVRIVRVEGATVADGAPSLSSKATAAPEGAFGSSEPRASVERPSQGRAPFVPRRSGPG